MSVQQTPAPARSDVTPSPTTSGSALRRRPYAVHGMLLTVGALAWAASQLVVGVRPEEHEQLAWLYGVGSGMFQVGLLALLEVLARTQALGQGRAARIVPRIEQVVVTIALASTISDTIGTTDLDKLGFALMDACWPLSMLGMFLIGIRIAVAGRWRGRARIWPMVAESWIVVTLPALALFGEGVATAVSVVNLTLGYAMLGWLVSRRDA